MKLPSPPRNVAAPPSHQRTRLLRILLAITVAYGLYWASRFPLEYDDDELPPSQRPNDGTSMLEPDQLVVSLKTTASDAWSELLPALVLADPTTTDTLLLMSDFQIDIGSSRVEDVLDRYNQSFVSENKELERYNRTLAYNTKSINLSALKENDPSKERAVLASLDKYKILRAVERAWELRPERKWYLFAPAHAYLARNNIYTWLGGLDPEQRTFFADASAETFVLSQAAIRALMLDHPDAIPRFDTRIAEQHSARDVLASVLSSALGLEPSPVRAGVSPFHPATLPFGPEIWCEHVLALAHTPVDVRSDIWRFERERRDNGLDKDPLLFADLWDRFLGREDLENARVGWDNLSGGKEYVRWGMRGEGRTAADEGWEACREACEGEEGCMQWAFEERGEGKCWLSRAMVFGGYGGGEGKRSGWIIERWRGWTRQQRCKSQTG